MPWLKLNPNEQATFRLLSGNVTVRREHWADGRSVECTGEGCPYCAQGKKSRKRYSLPIELDGEEYTWEFGARVMQQIIAREEDPARRKGALVTLKRVGEGLQTQYHIIAWEAPKAANGAQGGEGEGGESGAKSALPGDFIDAFVALCLEDEGTANALFEALFARGITVVVEEVDDGG